MTLTGSIRQAIDTCFAYDNIDDIISALDTAANESSNTEVSDWARKTKATIMERSPTSVKVTLKQLQLGKSWTIDHAFQREYHIASVFMEGHDFIEGVSARLIRKPAQTPKWQPATLSKVGMDDVDRYFVTRGQEQLQLYNRGQTASFLQYPHAWIGLPTEDSVREVVEQGGKSKGDVVRHFVRLKEGKLGVKEKVEEIVSRKTSVVEGALVWDNQAEGNREASLSRGSRDPAGAR